QRVGLLISLLAFPFQLLSILFVLQRASNTQPYQLGLTTHRLGRNVLLGALGWLILTPPVLVLNEAVYQAYQWLAPEQVGQHPFTQLAKGGLTGSEWLALVFLAVVAAPVLEELLFRGLLQPWLARRWWGGHAAMLLAVAA